MKFLLPFRFLLCLSLAVFGGLHAKEPGQKKLVIIAGKPSHPPGFHEFHAGALLFKKCLSETEGLLVEVHPNHWVSDNATLEDADGLVIYADGGDGHPALVDPENTKLIEALAERGAGIMMVHYAVQCADEGPSNEIFQRWIGGVYEAGFSANPIWEADYKKFPSHPISNGISPFKIKDEWYFSIRFPENQTHFTPILVSKPSDETRDGPYVHPKGPYPHIQARKGEEETMMWSTVRPGGGRGVGFTGGHFHKNWADDQFRKIVLNAMLWICQMDVPENGVESSVTAEDMAANLDDK